MDRRQMLRAMLGVAAASALPSEVWPFRKIFLPAQSKIHITEVGTWPGDKGWIVNDPNDAYQFLGIVKDFTIEDLEMSSLPPSYFDRIRTKEIFPSGRHQIKLNGEGKIYFKPVHY